MKGEHCKINTWLGLKKLAAAWRSSRKKKLLRKSCESNDPQHTERLALHFQNSGFMWLLKRSNFFKYPLQSLLLFLWLHQILSKAQISWCLTAAGVVVSYLKVESLWLFKSWHVKLIPSFWIQSTPATNIFC